MKNFSFITLDLETTGLDENSEIIEIALLKYVNGQLVDSYHSLVKPSSSIPQDITNLTGITDEMLFREPTWPEIEDKVSQMLEADFFIAHNAAFDKGFLERALKKPLDKKWVDTYRLAKIFLPGLSGYRLIDLIQYFDLDYTTLHRAYDDAKLTAEVFIKLLDLIANLNPGVLSQIIIILGLENEDYIVSFLERCLKLLSLNPFAQLATPATAEYEPKKEEGTALNGSLDLSSAENLLLPGGLLSQNNENYEHRPCQVEMLRTIIKCFQEDKHGLLEGGTGIGKSFAYLIPAILWSLENESKVLVATNTIALQEQLFNKDLPFLLEIMQPELQAALVKGRSNYICLRRYQRLQGAGPSFWQERVFLAMISYWLGNTKRGDKEELNLNNYENELWSQIANQQETCLGSKCPFYHRQCFFFKNRRLAENSNLLITNHALLLQDIKNDNKVLPKYDYCIIDEAHNLDDEATEQFSETLDFYQLQRICSNLTKTNKSGLLDNLFLTIKKRINLFYEAGDIILLVEELTNETAGLRTEILEVIEHIYQDSNLSISGEIRITKEERKCKWWLELENKLQIISGTLRSINLKLFQMVNELELEDTFEEILKEMLFYKTKILNFKENLEDFLIGNNEDFVYWLTIANPNKFKNLCLIRTPLKTGIILNELLFEVKKSVILTSATLTIANNFGYVAEQYALQDNYYFLNAPSPFDFEQQSLICIPNDLSEPIGYNEPQYVEEITRAIIDLLADQSGGVLILFTSYSMLNQVYRELKNHQELKQKTILTPGKDGNRNYIIEKMQKNPGTVVLGTNTFWEGIDVSGNSLSLVIITKLPFLPPNRPVIAARLELMKKQGLNAFMRYSLPKAVLKFRQGYGRLIRTKNDKGSIVVLDKRVISKKYGSEFLKSLPTQTILINSLGNIIQVLNKWHENLE